MTVGTLWTVTQLPGGVDRPWTAIDEWTYCDSCPQSAHPSLGQVIEMTSDLTTATWITVRMDVAVTHTDHSDYADEMFIFWGKEKGNRSDNFGNPGSGKSLTNQPRKIPVDNRGKTFCSNTSRPTGCLKLTGTA